MSTMAEDLPNLRNGITHQQKRTYPLTLCEEIPPNRSTMRGKQPVAENPLFHRLFHATGVLSVITEKLSGPLAPENRRPGLHLRATRAVPSQPPPHLDFTP